jgi:hypothetical protein
MRSSIRTQKGRLGLLNRPTTQSLQTKQEDKSRRYCARKSFPREAWGDPIPRKGRPNRTNHYENQVGALLLAANLKQFNKHCHYADGGMVPFIQTLNAGLPVASVCHPHTLCQLLRAMGGMLGCAP